MSASLGTIAAAIVEVVDHCARPHAGGLSRAVPAHAYFDRQRRELVTDQLVAGRFFRWAYETRIGRGISRFVASRRPVSAGVGWCLERRITRRMIPRFVERMNIPVDELERRVEAFESFSDFFSRRIDLSLRPIDPDPAACISPADGRILVLGRVHRDDRLTVKGSELATRALLGDGALAERLSGGPVAIVRLYAADYHHFHFPEAGVPGAAVRTAGRYHAVTPYSSSYGPPFYAENHRMRTVLESERLGTVVMVEIGAFSVGSIEQAFRPGVRVERGAHKGCFRFGGSTVVVLYEPGAVRWDDDLLEQSGRDVETYVRLGERIGEGRAP